MTAPNVEPEQAPVEFHFCSHCRDNAAFVKDEVEGWVSACCGWPPIPCDAEPADEA